MSVDFGRTAHGYRRYRTGFPEEFFWELSRYGIGLSRQRILDVGTGTGSVARGLAIRGAAVHGLDLAPSLLEQARELDREAHVNIEYALGRAESLPYESDFFDAVTAGQCWHWFERDLAAVEIRRVPTRGGILAVAHFDWLPIRGSVVAETEALILAHNPRWTMAGATGFYPEWCEGLMLAGFEQIRTQSFDSVVEYSYERWRGRIRASAGVAAALSSEGVVEFDREHGDMLAQGFADPLEIPHRLWMLMCRKPY